MMEILLARDGNVTKGTLDDVRQARQMKDREVNFWVDVTQPTVEELKTLQGIFGFHDLAIEECQDQPTKPGITDYETHCFIVVHVPASLAEPEPEIVEMNVFLGHHFLVTVRHQPVRILSVLREHCLKQNTVLGRGADFVFYSIMDDITDEYFQTLERLDEEIDELEDQIMTAPTRETLNRIFLLKRQLVHLRRVAGPQREIFAMLNNREFPYIKERTLVYFRDVHDHLIRVYELIDSMRELLSSALDAYLSQRSNQLNEVMKILTMLTTIFMPMTLISSIYGMNFAHMPELKWTWGYPFALGLMVTVGVLLLVLFKWRKWF
ncbi:MAG: magnesium/cobalt transporter CorA [Abditibacteriales bacterium]|nr:magnesium/cobalt transporter CorA [Abditibacteriales bacterium]